MRGYGLTDLEANLVVLSCLPEHHEGLSALARALHPSTTLGVGGTGRSTVGRAISSIAVSFVA